MSSLSAPALAPEGAAARVAVSPELRSLRRLTPLALLLGLWLWMLCGAALEASAQEASASDESAESCAGVLLPDFRCDYDREARPKGHIAPMSMPFFFEDPFITTELQSVGIYHNYPNDSILGGGETGIVALQARLAITDRLAFIATKDGFMVQRPNNNALDNETGFLNIAAGFKYAVIDDRELGLIVTPSLRYEIPSGQDQVLQGWGDGIMIPAVSLGYGPEDIHLVAAVGAQLPFDGDDNSTSLFYNIHLSQAFDFTLIPGAEFFVPFIELNGHSYFDSGDGNNQIVLDRNAGLGSQQPLTTVQDLLHNAGATADRRGEGVDVANLGSKGMAGENIVTMAWGFRVPFRNGISAGFSYERVLSQREDIFEQRATWMVAYTW